VTDLPALGERLQIVQSAVTEAAAEAGRNTSDITTVVVAKFHPASLVRQLAELGVTQFGENRHQDAAPKAAELADLALTWHFIGQLQTNKARAVLEYATVIQSVDRVSLAEAIASRTDGVDVFLQLNLTGDSSRGGVAESDVDALVDRVLEFPQLRLRGLMAVAPLGEEPRAAFTRVRETSERIRRSAPHATALSMGMSGDFREAVLEGATHLRIGTAITGKRPDAG
jgi:hypothetical protein